MVNSATGDFLFVTTFSRSRHQIPDPEYFVHITNCALFVYCLWTLLTNIGAPLDFSLTLACVRINMTRDLQYAPNVCSRYELCFICLQFGTLLINIGVSLDLSLTLAVYVQYVHDKTYSMHLMFVQIRIEIHFICPFLLCAPLINHLKDPSSCKPFNSEF